MTGEPSPTATFTDPQEPMVKVVEVNATYENADAVEFQYTKDFGFLPIPRHLRYNPAKPPHFGLALNIAFGFASTFSECLDHP